MTDTAENFLAEAARCPAAYFFPRADTDVVAALIDRPKPLARYLSQVSEITVAEALEILSAFVLDAPAQANGQSAA